MYTRRASAPMMFLRRAGQFALSSSNPSARRKYEAFSGKKGPETLGVIKEAVYSKKRNKNADVLRLPNWDTRQRHQWRRF